MKILFVDDNPHRHKKAKQCAIGNTFAQAYTAQEAIYALTKNQYDLVFLDHDLDENLENQLVDGVEDGRTIAKYLVGLENYKDVPIVIHSLNPRGAETMEKILVGAGFKVVFVMPHAWENFEKLECGSIGIKDWMGTLRVLVPENLGRDA